MIARSLVGLLALLAGACGSDEKFTIVTIESRPAVHDVARLKVTLANAGTSRTDELTVGAQSFPATFSISAPGRTGVLDMQIDAFDDNDLLVGRGTGQTTVEADVASIMLDSTDFVVNTDFADDQFPSDDSESNGFQIAAAADGTWTVVYRDRCNDPCNMFARRFDEVGRPLESALAAGTNAFSVSNDVTLGNSTPAVATAGAATVAVWNFSEPSPSIVDGVACRALDAAGNSPGPQVDVSLETFPDTVSVAALPSSQFAVAWNGFVSPNNVIKAAIVDARCQPSNVVQVSVNAGASIGPIGGAVAANGDRVIYAWILDGDARIRVAGPTNNFLSSDVPIVARTATEDVEHVRVAPLGTGFAVLVRWRLNTGNTGPGRIELYRTNNAGALMGGPTLVTTRSGSDFNSSKSFGVSSRPDGALMVVWHSCEENGDGSGCGVFGRVLRPTGVPVGDEIVLATTTDGEQTSPAVAGIPGAFVATWKDDSGKEPDRSGSAVRARVLYPIYDDAKGVSGAACSGADCGTGLACGASSDGGQRCFATCNPTGTPPLCPAGGTCTQATGGSACVF